MNRSLSIPGARAKSSLVSSPVLLLLSAMELTARTGYQMGKSPILPLFAASVGAGAAMSGVIVAISATTGLLTSPLIGALSDRYGRSRVLLTGTVLFTFVPFAYLAVETPGQLVAVRLGHGFATAVYGPVITAAVADAFARRRAEAIGWYRSARTAAYLIGPPLGGAVLLYADPRTAWIAVAAFGGVAFLPGLALASRLAPTRLRTRRVSTPTFMYRALALGFRDRTVLNLSVAQIALYAALRANSAFLPIWAISQGMHPGQIGLVLGAQVLATLVAQPVAGRLADRVGERVSITGGLLLVGGGLFLVGTLHGLAALMLAAVALGLGEAAIAPVIGAAATRFAGGRDYGGRLGLLEATDNIGKVLGPVAAGFLIAGLGHSAAYATMVVLVLAIAAMLYRSMRYLHGRPKSETPAA